MNGRVYDYNLGRFMGVDPIIQDVGNSQGINPYSYIMNNPLSGTDPTGYEIEIIITDFSNQDNKEPTSSEGNSDRNRSGGSSGSPTSGGNRPQGMPSNGAQRAMQSQAKQYGSVSEILSQSSTSKDSKNISGSGVEPPPPVYAPIVGNPIHGMFKSLARGLTGGILYGDISSIPGLNAGPVDNVDIEAYEAQAGLGQYAMMILPGNAAQAGIKAARTSFTSFSSLKRTLGPAGPGNAWHHIVEQTAGNIRQFGAGAIHNVDNIVKIPHGKGQLHQKISGFYSSKQPFTGGQTVRQWISSKSYAEQYDFGIKVMNRFKER